jgi:hypothetical protein
MSTKLAIAGLALLALVGCGQSAEEKAQAEQKAKEEALRQMVEQAASQKPQYVPVDGGPATRPLVPEGFGKGTWPPPEQPAAQEQPKPVEPEKTASPQ